MGFIISVTSRSLLGYLQRNLDILWPFFGISPRTEFLKFPAKRFWADPSFWNFLESPVPPDKQESTHLANNLAHTI